MPSKTDETELEGFAEQIEFFDEVALKDFKTAAEELYRATHDKYSRVERELGRELGDDLTRDISLLKNLTALMHTHYESTKELEESSSQKATEYQLMVIASTAMALRESIDEIEQELVEQIQEVESGELEDVEQIERALREAAQLIDRKDDIKYHLDQIRERSIQILEENYSENREEVEHEVEEKARERIENDIMPGHAKSI